LAQEAEEHYRHLIKAFNLISERPLRGGPFYLWLADHAAVRWSLMVDFVEEVGQ
jgi:hypothetical protein